MTNEIMNPNEIKFKSDELNEATATILQAIAAEFKSSSDANIRKAKAIGTICKAEINWKEEGFENLEDYGKKCFNWGKAQTYNYRSVGLALLDGRLPLTDTNDKPLSFTVMCELMNQKDNELRNRLLTDGIVTGDSTAAETRTAVKATKTPRAAGERKEKEVQVFCMEDETEPVCVTTPSHYKDVNGVPFHEWKQDGKVYMLYISGGFATVYWYSTGKVIDTTAKSVTE